MLLTASTKVECNNKGEYTITGLHGWNYKAVLNKQGRISQIGCQFRFALTKPELIGNDFIVTAVRQAVLHFISFEKYDVLEVDWLNGEGWGQYSTLKEKWEHELAIHIVNGDNCPSVPHWLKRNQMKFRIVDGCGAVKFTQDGRVG